MQYPDLLCADEAVGPGPLKPASLGGAILCGGSEHKLAVVVVQKLSNPQLDVGG